MKRKAGKPGMSGLMQCSEEDYLRSLYEEMGRGFLILDSRDRIISSNKSCARMLGTAPDHLCGRTLSSITPSRYRKLHSHHRKELRRSGTAQQYEGAMLKEDGTFVPVMIIRYHFITNTASEYVVIHDISSKMEMMKELSAFRDKCDQIFESTLDGLFAINRDGIITACNSALERIFRMKKEQVIGKPYGQFLDPEKVSRIDRNLKKRLKGDLQLSEYRVKRLDGVEIDIEVLTQAVRNPDGSHEFVGTVRDISDRKNLYERLRQSEETHKILVENAKEMMFILSHPDGSVLYGNPSGRANLEHKGNRKAGFIVFVHPDDRRHYRAALESLEKDPRKSVEYSFRMMTANNIIRHVSANSVLLTDQNQRSRIISVLRDVTEQKYLEHKIKTSEELWRNVFDHANDLIMIFNKDGRILDCNRRVEIITGFPRRELLSMTFQNLCPDSKALPHLKKGIPSPGDIDAAVDVEISRSDGTAFSAEFMLSPMYDDERRLISYLGVARDVSERKRLHDQLLQAEKLFSLGEIISGVAHELNNPLSVVLGCAELISKSSDLPKHLSSKCNLITNGAVRCARIIDNMVSFAREDELNKEFVDVHTILGKALELHAPRFKTNSISVERDFEKKPLFTMADPIRLQQVFLNLIHNSIDAIKDAGGGGRIIIRSFGEGAFTRVEVLDNGSGIPAAIRNRIFDPFFTTKEVGKGTGLGLSVSYGIIKEHGGELLLDKSYRKGAKFVVLLPAVKPERARSPEESVRNIRKTAKARRILMVDADAAILRLCEEILMDSGYIVETVSDGAEALSLIRSGSYDGILIDMLLDGAVSGKDILHHIMAVEPDYRRKVALVTIESACNKIRHFIMEHKFPHISKPFHIKELLDLLSAITYHPNDAMEHVTHE